MKISKKDRDVLRKLAGEVKEISQKSLWKEKIELWKKHNKLEKVRPMVMIFLEDGDV